MAAQCHATWTREGGSTFGAVWGGAQGGAAESEAGLNGAATFRVRAPSANRFCVLF